MLFLIIINQPSRLSVAVMDVESSQVSRFYAGKNIFLTGGTGFLGKCFIEKVLRSCPDVGTIYMLCRGKRGKSPKERMTALFSEMLFDNIRAANPDVFQKVVPVIGDVMEKNLGISEEDEKLITENVNIMIHSAATIRFDEHIKLSLQLNVGGTVKMVELARRVKNLISFIHVSTAYANCNIADIEEVYYEMGEEYSPLKLLELCDWMDEDVIASMTETLLRDRPNTYCLTKAVTEEYLFKHAKDIPLGIFRPSIIGASWQEPAPGWIDNFNGPSGLFIAVGKGVLRILEGDVNKVADIIPIDYCVNMLICVGWYTSIITKQVETPLIYHCTSGSKKPYTWLQLGTLMLEFFQSKEPYNEVFRRPDVNFATNKLELEYWKTISHWVPAYIADGLAKITGKKAIMLRAYDKVHKASKTFTFFTKREWTWTDGNCNMLMGKMSDIDKSIYSFNVHDIIWEDYYPNYFRGTKKYILKEDMSDSKLQEARAQQARWRYIYNIAVLVFISSLLYFLYPFISTLLTG